MKKQNVAWWRDSRFVVAGVIVPVILAVIALAPRFLGQRTSDELSVSFVVRDARRVAPSIFDMSISERFTVREESGSDAARVMADELANEFQVRLKDVLPKRERIEVPVQRGDDGALYIDESLSMIVTLHLTRFEGINDIRSVLPYAAQTIVEEGSGWIFPETGSEASVTDPRMKAGVYRIVLTAPGYRDEYVYLQLTDTGTVLMGRPYEWVEDARFPMVMQLFPASVGLEAHGLRIALSSCETILAATSEARFRDIGAALESALTVALRRRGFNTVLLEPDQRVGFDLNESKNLSAPKGLVRSDLVIEQCRSEWID